MISESTITPVETLPDLDADIKSTITRDPSLLQVIYFSHFIPSPSSSHFNYY